MQSTSLILIILPIFASVSARTLRSEPELSYSKYDKKCILPEELGCNLEACFKHPGLTQTMENLTVDPWPATEFLGYIPIESAKTQGDCCWSCANKLGCKTWLWSPNEKSQCRHAMENQVSFVKCRRNGHLPLPMVSGQCNPKYGTGVSNSDEDILRPKWNPFQTPMKGGTSVCLLTSQKVHVNGKMKGYWFNSKEGSSPMGKNFISELGLIWKSKGVEHKVRIETRSSSEPDRKSGFLKYFGVDGRPVKALKVGESASLPGDMVVKFLEVSKEDSFDVEIYSIVIEGILNLNLRVKPADDVFQTENEAFIHFEVLLNELPGEEGTIGGIFEEEFNEVQEDNVLKQVQQSSEKEGRILVDFFSESVLMANCRASTFNLETVQLKSTL